MQVAHAFGHPCGIGKYDKQPFGQLTPFGHDTSLQAVHLPHEFVDAHPFGQDFDVTLQSGFDLQDMQIPEHLLS